MGSLLAGGREIYVKQDTEALGRRPNRKKHDSGQPGPEE